MGCKILRDQGQTEPREGERSGGMGPDGPPREGVGVTPHYLACRSVFLQGLGQTLCMASALGKAKAN